MTHFSEKMIRESQEYQAEQNARLLAIGEAVKQQMGPEGEALTFALVPDDDGLSSTLEVSGATPDVHEKFVRALSRATPN